MKDWGDFMKKYISIVLSVCVLVCAFSGLSVQAYAAGWPSYAQNVELDSSFTDMGYETDPYSLDDGCYMDIYRFNMPAKGTVTLKLESQIDSVPCFRIYKTSNTEESLWFGYDGNRTSYDYDYAKNGFYSKWSIKLGAGTYYLMTLYGNSTMNVNFKYSLKFKPSFSNTSIISKTGRKKAVKLGWTRSGRATGYKLQYSTRSDMKKSKTVTVKGASTTNKTIKGLKSKKTYYFRIKAYKKVKVAGTTKTYTKSWSSKKSVKTK